MSKIVYLSPGDLGSLNGISSFANSSGFTEILGEVDYHFILFSTLYQSGALYFQTDKEYLPQQIKNSDFWKDKIIGVDIQAYNNATKKVNQILDGKWTINTEDVRGKFLVAVLEVHLGSLFYCLQTGNSFVNIHSLQKHIEFIKKGINKELWISLKNLLSTIIVENVVTITPKYSALKKDIKRFEDICSSRLFINYQNSINLITQENKIEKAKKEISISSLKLFNKYGNYLSLNDTVFNLIKFGKKILDLFVKVIPPAVGDFVLSSVETMIKNKRTIQFYEIKEIMYDNVLVSRIDEAIQKKGFENFKNIIKQLPGKK